MHQDNCFHFLLALSHQLVLFFKLFFFFNLWKHNFVDYKNNFSTSYWPQLKKPSQGVGLPEPPMTEDWKNVVQESYMVEKQCLSLKMHVF